MSLDISFDEVKRIRALRQEGLSEAEIAEEKGWNVTQLRVAVGKALRQTAAKLADESKSNQEIAEVLDVSEETAEKLLTNSATLPPGFDMFIKEVPTEDQTIWFPGIYTGRQGVYARKTSEFSLDEIVKLVQMRAQEDGEWAIKNGFVGNNEDKMRKMMAWVSNEDNIRQCLEANPHETIDWICRDLANGSKWVGGEL